MTDHQVFADAKWIINELENNGYEAYYVGGSVRDYLMNKSISDVDITTSATPEEVEKIFAKTIPIGKEHGTIIVVNGNQQFEVTTFRKDGDYVDYRRPSSVQFVENLLEDLARRDFTMNAIAMDSHYKLHDYFNGHEDIKHSIIRAVGTPSDRMEEDALRIMRGIRFQSQTGFTIEQETLHAMKSHVHILEMISIERIIIELKKFISGEFSHQTISSLNETEVFKHIPFFNEINSNPIFIPHHKTFNIWIGILLFLYEIDYSSLSKLKISNKEKKEILSYYSILQLCKDEKLSRVKLIQLVYEYGNDKIKESFELIHDYHDTLQMNYNHLIMNPTLVDEIYAKLPIYNKNEIAINGQILMSRFNKNGGPWIKDVMNKIEQAILLKEVKNTQVDLLEWVRTNVEI